MESKKTSYRSKRPKIIPLKMDANFFFEKAMQSLDRYRYDKALKYFQRAVEYEPRNPINHCNMAGIYSEIGNYERSNEILFQIIDDIDPAMTECHFYMANNYANMEAFEEAEQALLRYLEKDPRGAFLEECEEMIEMLSYELERPIEIPHIKSREVFFEHDKARGFMEEGKFAEAVQLLKEITEKHPQFLAAYNNLALAYFYLDQMDLCMGAIEQVLAVEEGNVHALCNLAIVYKQQGEQEKLQQLLQLLRRTIPFHQEHVFKLAMTLGLLDEHRTAYLHFRRLMHSGEFAEDPCLHHYFAVASFHMNQYDQAKRYWEKARQLDTNSAVPSFYLSHFDMLCEEGKRKANAPVSYQYYLPFEERLREWGQKDSHLPADLIEDAILHSSLTWALQHGDESTKLQMIQIIGMLGGAEAEGMLRDCLKREDETDRVRQAAVYMLQSIGAKEPYLTRMDGKEVYVYATSSSELPEWKTQWQAVIDLATDAMRDRYDQCQKHDMQTLWKEFLGRVHPNVPTIQKPEGWAAALEYLTAQMHSSTITYTELSRRYGVTAPTIRRHVGKIDEICGLKEKMSNVFSPFQEQ
ncbi:tetratricopeptide repeat protein [Marinicrinis sediminis]|uniref:Tetratricopeptide repeat protein n=1 Tax=Marinicrinis sediminis TaxID=1652465 RepID=A0ABW5R7J7_9BACL